MVDFDYCCGVCLGCFPDGVGFLEVLSSLGGGESFSVFGSWFRGVIWGVVFYWVVVAFEVGVISCDLYEVGCFGLRVRGG